MQPQLKLTLTLTTAGGRIGVSDLLIPKSEMTWSREWTDIDGDDQTVNARFELVKGEEVANEFEVDGDAWRQLESEGDMAEFVSDCVSGSTIESALRAQLDVFENHYEHEECGATWTDTHSCGCDDECPKCGASISPHDSVMQSGLSDDYPAKYLANALADA
ncbi:hypothetical protein [Methylibium petroleiphilum]|uniref:Uncharacterized protein n=1 Tax=Methylibium petroleiphilum (strain ATCC BAA-1232 / LMG 22953 / PM1) TaxID=420662 RepID=A2SNC2_METPP|nr:hypothetical protein [Methylibium petroleiphilum]ABM97061.1 hypothetical protein Mpe_B0286 [Methylibium petroleiphilum PM1]